MEVITVGAHPQGTEAPEMDENEVQQGDPSHSNSPHSR